MISDAIDLAVLYWRVQKVRSNEKRVVRYDWCVRMAVENLAKPANDETKIADADTARPVAAACSLGVGTA